MAVQPPYPVLPAGPLRSRHEADWRNLRLLQCQFAMDAFAHLLAGWNRLIMDVAKQFAAAQQPDMRQFSQRSVKRSSALGRNALGKIGKPVADMLVDEARRFTPSRRIEQNMSDILELEHQMVVETTAPVGDLQNATGIALTQLEHRRGTSQVIVGQPDRLVRRGTQAVVEIDGGIVGGQFAERGRLG